MISLVRQTPRHRLQFPSSGFQNWSLLKPLMLAPDLHLGWLSAGYFFGARRWNRALLPLRFPKYPFALVLVCHRCGPLCATHHVRKPAMKLRQRIAVHRLVFQDKSRTIQLRKNNETESYRNSDSASRTRKQHHESQETFGEAFKQPFKQYENHNALPWP